MFKKDYFFAAIIGFVTAVFASILVVYADIPLEYGRIQIPLWSLFVIFPLGEYVAYVIASRLFSHILTLKQLGRFAIVGLMNFCVDVGILSYLSARTGIYSGVGLVPLNVISVSVAVINSYFWQRGWTFQEKTPPSTKEFTIFVVITVLGIVINTAILYLMTEFSPTFNLSEAQFEVVAKVAATLVSLFWNFFGYKLVVFKSV